MHSTLSHLSDGELIDTLKRLVISGRDAGARLIAHLGEMDDRRLCLGLGFPSLFVYCTEVLELSEHEAYHRILAARTAKRFPRVLEMLVDGSLNLTTVRLLAAHLTDDNHAELLATAAHRTKRQVEVLVAERFPLPDAAPLIRRLPAAPLAPLPVATVAPATAIAPPQSLGPAPLAAPRPMVSPLAPDRYLIRFTARAETCEKLEHAKDLLRHAVPTADLAEIFDRALTALLAELCRKKFAATARPRATRTRPGPSSPLPCPREADPPTSARRDAAGGAGASPFRTCAAHPP